MLDGVVISKLKSESSVVRFSRHPARRIGNSVCSSEYRISQAIKQCVVVSVSNFQVGTHNAIDRDIQPLKLADLRFEIFLELLGNDMAFWCIINFDFVKLLDQASPVQNLDPFL